MKLIAVVLVLVLTTPLFAKLPDTMTFGLAYTIKLKPNVGKDKESIRAVEVLGTLPANTWEALLQAERMSHGKLAQIRPTTEQFTWLAQHANVVHAQIGLLEIFDFEPTLELRHLLTPDSLLLDPRALREQFGRYLIRLSRRVNELTRPPQYDAWFPRGHATRSIMHNSTLNPIPWIGNFHR